MTATLTRPDVIRRIEDAGVIAVVRLTDSAVGREVANALLSGGVTAIEITMAVPRAVELIAELVQTLPQALIGAGTITDPNMARQVIDAGAKFVVSPVFRPRIIEACHERDVPVAAVVQVGGGEVAARDVRRRHRDRRVQRLVHVARRPAGVHDDGRGGQRRSVTGHGPNLGG